MTKKAHHIEVLKNPPQKTEGFFLPDRSPKHLLSIKDLKASDIEIILNKALEFKKKLLQTPDKKFDDLKGKTVMSLFFEPSTRTKTSFEMAARRLSADIIGMAVSSSSLTKGESLKDMVENLEALGPHLMVVRHGSSGGPLLMSQHTKAAVISAGDGSHSHPSQALLDLFTAREKLGSLKGLKVLIIGDIAYSRVARSNIYGFVKMGAKVTCVGPATLLPPGLESLGVSVATNLDDVLPTADIAMLLRIQKERQEKMNFPSLAEYTHFYGLTKERARRMKAGACIMHPGPINRGVEIDPEVADNLVKGGAKAIILDQVNNGLFVRMAILSLWGSL